MEETSKHEDILQYEIDALKEIRSMWFQRGEERTRRGDILRGTAFGLVLGISGYAFVQFLYPIVESLPLGGYKPGHLVNLVVCMTSLVAVVLVSVWLCRALSVAEDGLKLSRKSVEVIEYAIKRRQHDLEQRKNGSNQSAVKEEKQ